MSIIKSYRSPFPTHASEFHIAMYEIASRYGIAELKTHANLEIHRTLEMAFDRGLGEEELWPVYNIHLHPSDGPVAYLLQTLNASRDSFTEQKARNRELIMGLW